MATANFNDMATLATDPVFGNRVVSSLFVYCTITIPSEAITDASVHVHVARKQYAASVLNSTDFFKARFVNAVACNQIVANEATVSGTIVGQTGATLAASAALCLDGDISNAVAAAFNAFIATL